MKVWIVVEGPSDLAVLRSLLPKEVQSVCSFTPTGGRSNILSVARTLLVKHQEPVAVLTDTDSLDPAAIRDSYVTSEQLLRAAAGGIPFKVIPCIPVMESIFFESTEILSRIFPKVNHDSYVMFYKTQPKEALAFLLAQGGGPTTLAKLLQKLTEEDVEQFRATYPIPELLMFIHEVLGPVGKQATT